MPELDLSTLNCVYFALFFVGVGYALFIVITGGLSDIDMPDVDIDIPTVSLPGDMDVPGGSIQIGAGDVPAGGIDAPDVTVSPLSPITIATFITTFGGVGVLCLQLFQVSPAMSLVWSVVAGLAAGGLMYLFYSQFLIGSQGSSELRRGELVGLDGEVTVPIGKETPGQIAVSTKAGRMTAIARSADGKPIARGQFVQIVRTIGYQVLVVPLSPEGEEAGASRDEQ